MTDQSGDRKGGDELLEKLDQLLSRHRPSADANAVPTLAPPVAAVQDNIPVLTDAVSGPAIASRSADQPMPPETLVENRLCAVIVREVNRLQVEMPQYSRQLAILSTTLAAAVRLLARRHFAADEHPPSEDPEQRS